MTISRVGGPMLNQNLIRQGVDLSFETDLLYLDVNNMRIGVNTAMPNYDLDVLGDAKISNNLILDTANVNQIFYSGSSKELVTSPNLTFDGTNIVLSGDMSTLTFTQTATSAPSTPDADTITVYVTASGVSPNREVAYKIKNELGEEVIITSILI